MNYHTHTARCMHAEGTDEQYVLAAIEGGFRGLGFADHIPWPFKSGFVSPIRMPMSDLDGYLNSVNQLRERYADRIELYMGMESEYFPRYRDHYDYLRDRGCQYFILGQHYNDTEEENDYIGFECETDDGVKRYADQVAEALNTGIFCYVAHPDLFMRHRTADQYSNACIEAAKVICQAAKEANVPIEYNLLGLDLQLQGRDRGYPSTPFWQQASAYGNRVILGVDAHKPSSLSNTDLWEEGIRRVNATGLELQESISL
ncbi:MAG: histidinol-phosphatase [Clostridia bacterium]|nr:histidinol-phosphatase [Clostridia bacterium]